MKAQNNTNTIISQTQEEERKRKQSKLCKHKEWVQHFFYSWKLKPQPQRSNFFNVQMLYSIAFSELKAKHITRCRPWKPSTWTLGADLGFSELKQSLNTWTMGANVQSHQAYPAEASGGIPLSPYPATHTGDTTSRNTLSPIPPAPRAGHPLSLLSPPIPPAAMAAPLPLSPSQPLSRHCHWRFKLPASVNGDTHVKKWPPLNCFKTNLVR